MATVARKQRSKSQPKSSVAALRDQKGGGSAAKSTEQAAPGTKRRKAWENIKSIATTVALFLLIRAFLIEAYRIPSVAARTAANSAATSPNERSSKQPAGV